MNFTLFVFGALIAYLVFDNGGIMTLGSNLIERMADAIQRFEGWQPGVSLSWKNNNPGNIKFFGGQQWQGQIGVDQRQFVIFDTYENGRRALIISLRNAATGKSGVYNPNDSLFEFFKKYAPASDNNYPEQYAKFVADQIGVSMDTPISQLV